MIEAPSLMCGNAALVIKKAVFRLRAITKSQNSSSISAMVFRAQSPPTTFTRMSMGCGTLAYC